MRKGMQPIPMSDAKRAFYKKLAKSQENKDRISDDVVRFLNEGGVIEIMPLNWTAEIAAIEAVKAAK